MRSLFIGVSSLALMASTAYAQAPKPAMPQPVAPMAAPKAPAPAPALAAAQAEAAKFLVFFDWDKATLTPEARRVIASAADEFKKIGSTRIVATGYTDLSGTPQYNLALSERRPTPSKRSSYGSVFRRL